AFIARDLHGAMNRAECRAPADDRELPVIVTQRDALWGNVARDPCDLVRARLGHARVVVGIVGDVTGVIISLEAADAMLELRGAGLHPRPRQRLGIAQERMESLWRRPIRDREAGQLGF